MHSKIITIASLALLSASVQAQAPSSGQQTLAGSLDIYVFPSKGQTPAQQSEDEAGCYQWAVTNSGTDPFDAQKQMAASAQEGAATQEQIAASGQGAGARGAVGGAAAGALIGEIVDDDAGKGAAWGAGLGAIHNRRHTRRNQAEASQGAAAETNQSVAASQADIGNFKKAFSACMEGKDYIAKY